MKTLLSLLGGLCYGAVAGTVAQSDTNIFPYNVGPRMVFTIRVPGDTNNYDINNPTNVTIFSNTVATSVWETALKLKSTTVTNIISPDSGLRIYKCHDGDEALIHIHPLTNKTNLGGSFRHTREFLSLDDLSMAPSGVNKLDIQTICAGATSEVRSVTVNIIRPIPAPIVKPARANLPAIPPPPTPGNLESEIRNAASIRDYQRRLDQAAQEGWRRSQ